MSSINYEVLRFDWEEYVRDTFDSSRASDIISAVDWDVWIMTPGMPPELDVLNFNNPDADAANTLADYYIDNHATPSNYESYLSYYSNQKVIFHVRLLNRKYEFDESLMSLIDQDLHVTQDPNPEVKQRWHPLGIEKSYLPVFDAAYDFVSSQGRSKYLNPIY